MLSLERAPSFVASRWTTELREKLFECYINFSISKELSDWLQELGRPSYGTLGQQLARLRERTASLVLPAEPFPRQTIYYLSHYDPDILSEICQELGIRSGGSAEILFKRIYGEVGLREGWLRPIPEDARLIIRETFFPILRSFGVVKDYSMDVLSDLSDSLGEDNEAVHAPLAYGRALIVVVIPDLLQEAQAVLVHKELKNRGDCISEVGKKGHHVRVEVTRACSVGSDTARKSSGRRVEPNTPSPAVFGEHAGRL
jgi:hypothetical protein